MLNDESSILHQLVYSLPKSERDHLIGLAERAAAATATANPTQQQTTTKSNDEKLDSSDQLVKSSLANSADPESTQRVRLLFYL